MIHFLKVGIVTAEAPYYINLIAIYLFLLPFLVGISIGFVTQRKYQLHHFSQLILYVFTLLSLLIFLYEIYFCMDFKEIIIGRGVSYSQGFALLVVQTFLSLLTLILWMTALLFSVEDRRRRGLPGLYSRSHRKSGYRLFLAIFLTSISSLFLYWLLYFA